MDFCVFSFIFFYFFYLFHFNSICVVRVAADTALYGSHVRVIEKKEEETKKNITKLPYAFATGTSRARLWAAVAHSMYTNTYLTNKNISFFFFFFAFVVRPARLYERRYLLHLHILLFCFVLNFYCYSGRLSACVGLVFCPRQFPNQFKEIMSWHAFLKHIKFLRFVAFFSFSISPDHLRLCVSLYLSLSRLISLCPIDSFRFISMLF